VRAVRACARCGTFLLLAAQGLSPPLAVAQTQGEPLRLHRLPAPPPAPPPQWIDLPVAVLRGLDKSSGRTQTFEAPVGSTAPFGRLEIIVNACRTPPEGESEDAVAHVTVLDRKSGTGAAFSGWMFASAPALSALDHPRYDVWVIACRTASGSSS
jgi:hypothetical protein